MPRLVLVLVLRGGEQYCGGGQLLRARAVLRGASSCCGRGQCCGRGRTAGTPTLVLRCRRWCWRWCGTAGAGAGRLVPVPGGRLVLVRCRRRGWCGRHRSWCGRPMGAPAGAGVVPVRRLALPRVWPVVRRRLVPPTPAPVRIGWCRCGGCRGCRRWYEAEAGAGTGAGVGAVDWCRRRRRYGADAGAAAALVRRCRSGGGTGCGVGGRAPRRGPSPAVSRPGWWCPPRRAGRPPSSRRPAPCRPGPGRPSPGRGAR